MGNTRTIKVSALNVAMHKPHAPDRYVALLKDAYASRHLVRQGALHGAMLGSLYLEDRNDVTKGINGELFRFVKLDPDEPWFNLETKEAATDVDVRSISIPRHLLPHLQRIPFVFKPSEHELWFISHDRKERLGPRIAANIFQALFDRTCAERRYPQVEVTVIPDHDSLEQMFKLARLERIVIELKRPNSDDGASDEARLLRRLEKQRARRMTTDLVAEKHGSIVPDEETRRLAAVAARNGRVSVAGRDGEGRPVEESTDERPYIESVRVDSDIETAFGVLRRTAGYE